MSGGTGSPAGDGEPTGSDPSTASDAASDVDEPTGTLRRRLRSARRYVGGVFRAHFGIDARALAAFRICLGAVILLNLALRARYLPDFYTDAGLFPRSVMGELYPAALRLSIHAQFGSVEMQALLFVLAGLAALALMVGYRSSLAAVVSLVLLFSLHGRNPIVLNGGDILLRHLLFWTILLPVAERWSVDAVRRSRAPRARIASVATAGLLLQVFAVYAINAVLKNRGQAWQEGTATQYIFQLDQFTVLLGDYVAQLTPLVDAFGFAWYWMLTVSVLLLVFRGWPRAIFAAMFVGAHASMLLTMQLGVFPLVSITSLLVFFPAVVWDRVERYVARPAERYTDRVRAALAGGGGLPRIPSPSWWGRGRSLWRRYVVPGVAAIAVFVMVVNNVGAATAVDMGPVEATDLTEDDPRWNMFAPNPLRVGVWYVMEGTTTAGERVDAFHGGQVSYEPPPDMAHTYPTARWRKYFSYVDSHFGESEIRRGLAGYLCRQYNATHDEGLVNVTITKGSERINLEGNNSVSTTELDEFDCPTTGTTMAGMTG